MLLNGTVRAAALVAALMLGSSANALAQDARREVRQSLQDECQVYKGKDNGVCKRHAARTMKGYSAEARSEYKRCLDQGYSRAECNESQQSYWQNRLVY